MDGQRGNVRAGVKNIAKVNSHLVNMEYYISKKYPMALTASYEKINYRSGRTEENWPDAEELKFGIKYIFGGEKSLLAFDKERISHQPNVENYWAHLVNETE